jgi:hypothetical protein
MENQSFRQHSKTENGIMNWENCMCSLDKGDAISVYRITLSTGHKFFGKDAIVCGLHLSPEARQIRNNINLAVRSNEDKFLSKRVQEPDGYLHTLPSTSAYFEPLIHQKGLRT